MCTMNFKPILFISLFLFAGCGQRRYYELPNNHLSFPADGGKAEYVYEYTLDFSDIFINGERVQTSSLCVDSTYVGVSSEWISFIDGWRIEKKGKYIIEVKANPETQPRSAVLRFGLGMRYGDIFIYQEGRSD